MTVKINFTVLVAPLDWGLGHATRCIPIINQLVNSSCNVIIAGEGAQQNLLKTEFPSLQFISLPGYNISYSRNKSLFTFKIISQIPKIFKAIKAEKKWLDDLVENKKIDLIISDNRYGLYHKNIPSVLITHQLTIKASSLILEKAIQQIHYRLINKFSECWVPDTKDTKNLAGELSHPKAFPLAPVHYIGPLSRLKPVSGSGKKYKCVIILSGPEPQRTLFEEKILSFENKKNERILLVRGLPGNDHMHISNNTIEIKNHLTANELETAFAQSEYIISRAGYTTVMDVIKLKMKSILIPTPGQTEQEYLAKHLADQNWCMSCLQDNFNLIELLDKVEKFHFIFPEINMESYKQTISDLLTRISK